MSHPQWEYCGKCFWCKWFDTVYWSSWFIFSLIAFIFLFTK